MIYIYSRITERKNSQAEKVISAAGSANSAIQALQENQQSLPLKSVFGFEIFFVFLSGHALKAFSVLLIIGWLKKLSNEFTACTLLLF